MRGKKIQAIAKAHASIFREKKRPTDKVGNQNCRNIPDDEILDFLFLQVCLLLPLTAQVSRLPKAGRLDRRVRHDVRNHQHSKNQDRKPSQVGQPVESAPG